MINLYDKSRQLRVHMAIIGSQAKLAKDKFTRINKEKPNSRKNLTHGPNYYDL